MQTKRPVNQRSHTPSLPDEYHVILRAYFQAWTINDLIDTVIRTIPLDQQKNMVTQLKKAKKHV